MRQLPLPVRLRTSSVFESFFPGSNEAVVRQLRLLGAGSPPVVWLYGPLGTGKTHLLQAICARAQGNAAYLPLGQIDELQPELLTGYESLEFVCLDAIENIAGRAAWERALFRLYTELEDSRGRLVVASSSPPIGVSFQLRDLASRVAAGTVLRLQPLTDDEQLFALQARAAQLGLELPFDAAEYLLRRAPRDMTTLCSILEALDEESLASQRRLTLPLVRRVLDKSPDGNPSIFADP